MTRTRVHADSGTMHLQLLSPCSHQRLKCLEACLQMFVDYKFSAN